MSKHHQSYQSPFAAMLTEQRFPFASQLAAKAHLDPSQVMFAYLQITANVPTTLAAVPRQKEIDRRFQQFLTDAAKPVTDD
ncbi:MULTISPECIES: hypothetical protein [Levilactobacillus]|uniref:Uncharacterized protein n=1 Tax=Levilactobacillus tongjiangensis TaxID=2486023 RepID=A0ABW1SNN4_9LACO|nr:MULTISPECIES: hypothetical protein [Levilactobacillus]